jgi:riboflavin synthase
MFSGIIESIGTVKKIQRQNSNIHFTLECDFANELKIDQSVAHNGVCLTVVALDQNQYVVTAIEETLSKTNLSNWQEGTKGHVDTTATCTHIENLDGSWKYFFSYNPKNDLITVTKGSICINGVSLTVVDSDAAGFSVCIIPYTYEHTNFHAFKTGDTVNLEFDVIGKYIARLMHTHH